MGFTVYDRDVFLGEITVFLKEITHCIQLRGKCKERGIETSGKHCFLKLKLLKVEHDMICL